MPITAVPATTAFTPKSITGFVLWLDATDPAGTGVQPANGTTLSSWSDKSGNGNTVTQATTANQPTYVTNVVNNSPVVRFNGTTNILQNSSFTALGTSNVSFWLVERNLNGGNGSAPFSFNSGPNGGIVIQCNNTFQPFPGVAYNSPTARFEYYNRTNTGSGSSGYVNGTSVGSQDDTTGTYGTTFAVGQRVANSVYTSGDICEILIYTGTPTTTQRQQLEGYLAWKWGLQASLPSGHPYSSAAPSTAITVTPTTTFLPTYIPALNLWLDGNDPLGTGISPANGATLSSWVDKSGVGNTLTSYSSPTFATNVKNGLGAITMSGGYFQAATTSTNSGTTATLFVVAYISSTSQFSRLFSTGQGASAADYNNGSLSFMVSTEPTSTNISVFRSMASIQYTTTAVQNTYILLSIVFDGTNATMYYSGTQSSTMASTGSFGFNQMAIGRAINESVRPFSGYGLEYLFYYSALNTGQRQQIEGYLAWKWGLQSSLPSGHPYASSIPKTITTSFQPTNLPGCALWLDASDSRSLSLTGSVVNSWKDKSGNGYTGTSSGSPTLVTNSQNGLSCISFTASSSQYFNFGNILPQAPQSIFFAGKSTYVNGTSQCFIAKGLAGAQAGRWALVWDATIGNYLNYMLDIAGGGINTTGTITPYSGLCSLFEGVWNGTTATLYGNGTQLGTNSVSSAGTSNANLVLVGAYNNASGGVPPTAGLYYNGTMCEILVFSNALSTGQRQQVEGYLAAKWGITASLSNSHPYTTAPTVAVSSFVPRNTYCQLWLDASDTTTMTYSSSNVTVWNDKSGNANHMNVLVGNSSAAGTATYPYAGTPINGLPTLYFSPSAGLKQANTLDGVKHLFWIGRISSSGSSTNSSYMLLGHDTYYDWHTGQYGQTYFNTNGTALIGSASPASHITNDPSAAYNVTYSNIYFPSSPNVALLSLSGVTGSTRFQGICYDRVSNCGWCGDLAEVITFSNALTTAQVQQIEGYLSWKWGLQAYLPYGHPYGITRLNNILTAIPYYAQFSPTSIAGCQIWVDATDSSRIVTSGSSVTGYTDKARGITLTTQGTAANLTVVPNKINGLPTLYFNNVSGNNVCLTSATNFFSGTTTFTYFVVWTHVAQRTSWTSIVNVTRGGGAGAQLGVGSDSLFYYTGNGVTTGGYIALTQGTAYMAYYTATGTVSALSIFGNPPTVGTQTNVGTAGTSDYMTIAGETGLATTNTLYLGEVIFYNAALTITQRQQVESYLAQKWGLTSSLPSFSGPTAIAGCQLWLDGSDSSSMVFSSGSNITTWNDKSGLANNATAANGSPVFTRNSLNGYSSIYLSNAPCFRGSISITGTSYTAFVVAVTPSIPNTLGHDQRLLSFAASSTGPDYNSISSSVPFFNWVQGSDGAGTRLITYRNNTTVGSNAISASVPFLGSTLYNGANGYLWVNGTAASVTGAASSGNFAISVYGVGDHASNVGGEYWNGYIGEVIVYNTALTTLQQQKIEGYLANKWGLQASLPTSHPYYTGPPNHTHFTTPAGRDPIVAALVPTIPKGITAKTLPLGGTITTYSNYRVHSFTTVGSTNTLTIPSALSGANLLVVGGGGGGGGNYGGGGGAGGAVYVSGISVPAGIYTITIGGGGLGSSTTGNIGSNSSITISGTTYTGQGGGAGGSYSGTTTGGNGGCGGGGAGNPQQPGGTGSQGYGGGSGGQGSGGGGGGGMGQAGTGTTGNTGASYQAKGGDGLQYSITGTSVYYAGGGGGGAINSLLGSQGGAGGGGYWTNGSSGNSSSGTVTAGTDGLGGGGGGAPQPYSGANGGSGVVILSYPNQ